MRTLAILTIYVSTFLLLSSGQALSQYQLQDAFPNLPSFSSPVEMAPANDGSDRIFIVDQGGHIYVFDDSSSVSTAKVFLDLSDVVSQSGGETGLLGLAFHPNYSNNGYFYVDFTSSESGQMQSIVSRFRVSAANPDSAIKSSRLDILTQDRSYDIHNGGHLAFGSDGYLYIAWGDGGPEGDPLGNGQNKTILLGKILRINVDSASSGNNYSIPRTNPFFGNTFGYREEIYAYGLRNPWKISFDRATGTLWAGDVGQDTWEEIDTIIAGGNYGWSTMEGFACYNPSSGCDSTGLIPPLWVYDHSGGNEAIMGGYVYRGSSIPGLIGKYIYGDYASGRIWALSAYGTDPPTNQLLIKSPYTISCIGQDQSGEVYVVSYLDGRIYKLTGHSTRIAWSNPSQPQKTELAQNYPNPFNPTTTISYQLSSVSHVTLSVYDVLGREVKKLVDEDEIAGKHDVELDAPDLASGVYFYEIVMTGKDGKDFVSTKRMMVLK